MPKWVSALISAILPSLSARITNVIAYLMGRRAGRAEQQKAQDEADLKALGRGVAAGDAVKHDPDSVRNDSRNRDKIDGV